MYLKHGRADSRTGSLVSWTSRKQKRYIDGTVKRSDVSFVSKRRTVGKSASYERNDTLRIGLRFIVPSPSGLFSHNGTFREERHGNCVSAGRGGGAARHRGKKNTKRRRNHTNRYRFIINSKGISH